MTDRHYSIQGPVAAPTGVAFDPALGPAKASSPKPHGSYQLHWVVTARQDRHNRTLGWPADCSNTDPCTSNCWQQVWIEIAAEAPVCRGSCARIECHCCSAALLHMQCASAGMCRQACTSCLVGLHVLTKNPLNRALTAAVLRHC